MPATVISKSKSPKSPRKTAQSNPNTDQMHSGWWQRQRRRHWCHCHTSSLCKTPFVCSISVYIYCRVAQRRKPRFTSLDIADDGEDSAGDALLLMKNMQMNCAQFSFRPSPRRLHLHLRRRYFFSSYLFPEILATKAEPELASERIPYLGLGDCICDALPCADDYNGFLRKGKVWAARKSRKPFRTAIDYIWCVLCISSMANVYGSIMLVILCHRRFFFLFPRFLSFSHRVQAHKCCKRVLTKVPGDFDNDALKWFHTIQWLFVCKGSVLDILSLAQKAYH